MVEMDEIQDFDPVRPEDLLEEAASSLVNRSTHVQAARARKMVDRRLVPCPFCRGGLSVSKHSYLWSNTCWICSGWAVVPQGRPTMRGPFAPHPSRQTY